MTAPSPDDMERIYPLEDWSRDLGLWFSRRDLSPADFPRFAAYYHETQADNPKREDNCARMWTTVTFLQSHLPELVRAGAAPAGPSGETTLPPSLVTALYRAFMSPVGASNPRGITVPLILQVVKEQKDWNEDRS
jgi:hypothetical protein